ncbi:MAG: hypothetical protein IJZ69_04355 [Bacteroidales bacterium]|nr:hypothetical protein [Bacteroidales bacterium]MBQ8809546.1 hypothetical protein [Bacteroidales bacterium]
MATRIENQCVDCPPEMGCLGQSCPKKNIAVYVCDDCGDEIYGDIYEAEGDELCESCLKSRYVKVM